MAGLLILLACVGLGVALRMHRLQIAIVAVVLMAGFITAHLLLPDTSPIIAMIGGSLPGWTALLVICTLVAAYRKALHALRRRSPEPPQPGPKPLFNDAELERYARHILLREIGGPGQAKLKRAKVLVIGAGGLGSSTLYYLAAAGVGTIGVIDDDVVSNSNLQRQILHRDADIGMPKVHSAAANLLALNPYLTIKPYQRRLTQDDAQNMIAQYDLVVDGCDNFETRYIVNAACVATKTPLLSGAITQWEGQVSLYDPARNAPCYACIFPEAPAPGLAPTCAEAGVIGALPGIIGSMMASETLKTLTGAGQDLRGRLVIHDALWGESRQIRVTRQKNCPICGDCA
ncbi:molybdopterin biosynthesis protein [Thioclava sp. SK-1]|uniref:HesA/MoeB/ThiF family protein n=1 Tax=Thioclava sp. SK-1 TaxID=1889770 RepID=UPI00082672D6|nr:molybdopterin-synthase adenylyltransferase MoeB [Thioclava sp. SK-1]OCX61123.1 molybdopterin biosynthesis protein [Thioclava sp. SK-1]